MSDEILEEAYERLHRLGPEFGGDDHGDNGLTNHAPMAAEVLTRHGFGVDVEHWLDGYVGRLVEVPRSGDPVTDAEWRRALGVGRRLPDWGEYCDRRLQEEPWQAVLSTWWPRLLPGIAAGATHGVIRVGHVVRTLRSDAHPTPAAVHELALGLGFWAARSRVIPGVRPVAGTRDPAAALQAVPHLPRQSGLIVDRLAGLDGVSGWPSSVASLRAPTDDDDVVTVLRQLVDAATIRYRHYGYGSPVLLVHTATAPNAVLHVLPAIPRPMWRASLEAAWAASAALVAAYEPAEPRPETAKHVAPDGPNAMAEMLVRAVDHGDEHVIKFADTAAEVFARTGDGDAVFAAATALAHIDPRGGWRPRLR
jgi:hypothetical protein